jgi:CspA family cold shock protein
MQGQVKWFDDKRGYGFITGTDGVDVYVHYTAIVSDGYRTLKHNWRVEFDVVQRDGRAEAANVVVQPKITPTGRARR